MAVTRHAAADHRPLQDAQGGEQRRRPMPDIVVGHCPGLAGFDRQARLSAIERLNLALLIHRQHDGVARRGHVEADNRLQFGEEVGIAALLKGAQAMRLKLVRRPDPLHRAQRNAHGLCQHPSGPVGRLAQRLRAGECYDLGRQRVAEWRLAGLAGLVAQQAIDTGFGVASLPAPDRRAADASFASDRSHVETVGREQHDPRSSDMLLRTITIGDDRCQALAILGRNKRAERLCHAASIAQLRSDVNLKNASVH